MKPLTKRFTFVIIPDANQSVQRFRISGLLLWLLPTSVLLLAICATIFIYFYSEHTNYIDELQMQLHTSATVHNQQLTVKDAQLTALQSDLYTLAEQAKAVEQQIHEISELELQLKQIAGIDKAPVRISSIVETEDGGQGGEEFVLPVTSSNSLVADTMRNYSSISGQLTELKPSLEATKSAVIQHQRILDVTPTIWPVDIHRITSLFGARKDPFTGRSTYHNGLDLGGKTGDAIYATADGVVTLSEKTYPQGQNIMIDHDRGIQTRYLHLSKRIVEVGDQVTKGQKIGELGSTGRSTGPHLHYEVIANGTNVNPLNYITDDRKGL